VVQQYAEDSTEKLDNLRERQEKMFTSEEY